MERQKDVQLCWKPVFIEFLAKIMRENVFLVEDIVGTLAPIARVVGTLEKHVVGTLSISPLMGKYETHCEDSCYFLQDCGDFVCQEAHCGDTFLANVSQGCLM